MSNRKKIAVIGGGAAGFFFAINCAEKNPSYQITILEKSPKLLEKVRISGGGRCNVTHASFEPKALSKNYPRGERELISPFYQFQPQQLIGWFEQRGVKLKTEADGRMFPTTDNSETIVHCFLNEAKKLGIEIETKCGVDDMVWENEKWTLSFSNKNKTSYAALFIATGSAAKMWDTLAQKGHNIEPAVPSLFTFKIKDARIEGLMGVSVKNATATVAEKKLKEKGPILITHWGLSGPAILRLSAWGARALADCQHQFSVTINWTGELTQPAVFELFKKQKLEHPKKTIYNQNQFEIPARLWQSFCEVSQINPTEIFADVTNKKLEALSKELTMATFQVNGKSTNKDEFVTAGGVSLKEVDFKTMQSKVIPNVYLGGEVLNIDAITGGFNFQAAWSTAWIAANHI